MGLGGFFSSESKTSSKVQNTDNSQTASDQAQNSQFRVGGKNGHAAQAAAGAIALQGSGNTVNVQSLDGSVLQLAGDLIGKSVQAQSNLGISALQENAHLAETRLTDGQNIVGKNAVWIVLGIGAIFALVLFFKNR